MRVHWTNRARNRLREIKEYIEQENPLAAQELTEKILRRSAKLASPPEIGSRVFGYEHSDLREVKVRPFRIIYRILDSRIDVITVLHYRQLLPGDLLRR